MRKSEVAEVVSAIAVVLSLGLVAYELRENTRIERITATQTLSSGYERALDVLAQDSAAACIYVKGTSGLNNLDGAERLRFFVMLFQIYRSGEQLHFYAREGMVEPRIWRGYERQLTEVTALPGVQQWWKSRRRWFSDDFQVYVDGLVDRAGEVEPAAFDDSGCVAGQALPAE